jgi:hypothetical protein
MGMVVLLSSVIIDQLNVDGITVFKFENNPPVCADGNRPIAFQTTLELVQTI